MLMMYRILAPTMRACLLPSLPLPGLLRSVKDGEDLDRGLGDAIDHPVRYADDNDLPGTRIGAGGAKVRLVDEIADRSVDATGYVLRGPRAIGADILGDRLELGDSPAGEAEPHAPRNRPNATCTSLLRANWPASASVWRPLPRPSRWR